VSAWFRGRARTVAPAVGCFGKLPLDREFLRVNAHYPEVEGLDRWIQGGLAVAHEQLAGDPAGEGRGLYGGWHGSHFLLPPAERGQRYCLGHMAPSEDSAGRRYPCTCFLLLDARGAGPAHLLPLRYRAYLAAAEAVVAAGRGETERGAWMERVRSLESVAMPGNGEATVTEGDGVGALLAQLLPAGADATGHLQLLVEAAQRPRGGWWLALPAAAEEAVAAWLLFADHLRPDGASGVAAFWGNGRVWLAAPPLAPRGLLYLLGHAGEDDRLVDATEAATVAAAAGRAGEPVAGAVANATVAELARWRWR